MDGRCVRSFIEWSYGRAFDAHGVSVFSDHLSTSEPARAALGYRRGGLGPFFLEAYLDAPVEILVSSVLKRTIAREAIVEIGNLAAENAWAMIALWGDAANDLGCGSEVVVATLAAPLRAMFARMGVPVHLLAPADPSRLGTERAQWGTYYDHDPYVCAGFISEGQQAMASFMARRRRELGV